MTYRKKDRTQSYVSGSYLFLMNTIKISKHIKITNSTNTKKTLIGITFHKNFGKFKDLNI